MIGQQRDEKREGGRETRRRVEVWSKRRDEVGDWVETLYKWMEVECVEER